MVDRLEKHLDSFTNKGSMAGPQFLLAEYIGSVYKILKYVLHWQFY